jgi:hypothetical protein
MNIVGLLTLNSWPTALQLMRKWSLWSPCIFSPKAHHGLFASRKSRQHFSTTLEGHFKQCNSQPTHKNVENMALNKPWKELLFILSELKWEGRALACSPQLGTCILGDYFLVSLHMSMNDYKSTMTLILGFQINFSKEVNLQIWNPRKMIKCIQKRKFTNLGIGTFMDPKDVLWPLEPLIIEIEFSLRNTF